MRSRYNLSFRREQQKKERIKIAMVVAIILIILAALGTLIYFAFTGINWSELKDSADKKEVATEEKEKPKIVELTINSVGEITAYNAQMTSARTDDGYDFSPSFKNLKKYIKDGDLSLFNLETTFGGEPYQGYPRFNSPDELADAIKDAGFDIAVTANERALDSELEGIGRTIDTLDKAGLESVGTRKDKRDKNYLLTTVSGIKTGVVAFTQETSTNADNRTLDGNRMSEEEAALVNSYSPNLLEEDMEVVKTSIDNAKKDGAKIIIAYFNWGDLYDTSVNDDEKEIAQSLADMGVDMIFACNSHVVQEIEMLEGKGDKEVPVFYSLGNFLTAQRNETVGTRRVEQGIIAQVKVKYDTTSNKITDINYEYIPTWVDRYWDNDLRANLYTVIPLTGDLEKNKALETSGNLSRAQQALEDLKEVLDSKEDTGD